MSGGDYNMTPPPLVGGGWEGGAAAGTIRRGKDGPPPQPSPTRGEGVTRRTLLALLALAGTPAFATPPTPIRIATLKFGTVNWELDTIRHNGFDRANGIALDVLGMAGSAAAKIAFEGGAADALVADWIWVARQRAAGRDYVFIPYSRSVGSLIAREGRFTAIEDLRGMKIGIAGGPLDKGWLILRAYAQSRGFDLKAETQQVFGAPPLIARQAESGGVDAVLTYWHWQAKMQARGFAPVVGVADAAQALGLSPDIPLLGYVLRGEYLRENPAAVAGLVAASREAKALLATDDGAWTRLRPKMNAATDAEFLALRSGFRAGIPGSDPVDEVAAAKLFAVMAELGGTALVGDARTLPEGVFHDAP